MPYVTALEEILREIGTGVDTYLSKLNHTSDAQLSSININNISYIKSKNLDVILQGMFQEYASKLQESRERVLFDSSFDRVSLDNRLDKAKNIRYSLGVAIFYVTSAAITTICLSKILNPNYPGMYPILGSVIAGPLTLIEHWGGNPLGKLLMSNYTDSKVLGTRYYEDKIKYNYSRKIKKYARKHTPELLKEKENIVSKPIPVVYKKKVLDTSIFSN